MIAIADLYRCSLETISENFLINTVVDWTARKCPKKIICNDNQDNEMDISSKLFTYLSDLFNYNNHREMTITYCVARNIY